MNTSVCLVFKFFLQFLKYEYFAINIIAAGLEVCSKNSQTRLSFPSIWRYIKKWFWECKKDLFRMAKNPQQHQPNNKKLTAPGVKYNIRKIIFFWLFWGLHWTNLEDFNIFLYQYVHSVMFSSLHDFNGYNIFPCVQIKESKGNWSKQ